MTSARAFAPASIGNVAVGLAASMVRLLAGVRGGTGTGPAIGFGSGLPPKMLSIRPPMLPPLLFAGATKSGSVSATGSAEASSICGLAGSTTCAGG